MSNETFSCFAEKRKPILATGIVRPMRAPSRRVAAAAQEAALLTFVPVCFDLYRPLRPRLRWAMQCLVSFADHAGRCWPSCRKFAAFAGISKSAAGRHLAGLVEAGVATRKRRPGRGYEYEIDPRFLPRAPVSHFRKAAVPPQAGQETEPLKQRKEALPRTRFADRRVSYGEMPDDRAKWQARLRGWRKSRFWLPLWGAKPGEAGCMVPAELLTAAQGGHAVAA